MGKISRWALIIVPLLIIGIAVIYFTYNQADEDESSDMSDRVGEVHFYYIEENTPPKLSEYLVSLFEDLEIEEVDSKESADVVVTSDNNASEDGGDLQTNDTDLQTNNEDPNEGSLNLHQILVITKPFSAFLEEKKNIIMYVSPKVDSPDIETLLEEDYSLTVSRETPPVESFSGLSLLTLEEVNSTHIILPLEGIDPMNKETWEQGTYPLISNVTITSQDDLLSSIYSRITSESFLTDNNYLTELPEPSDLVKIIKTGTSVAGGPGWELCERVKGSADYPVNSVRSTLSGADYTIISNESSFMQNCSQSAGTTSFCGKPEYIQNLIDIGTDIVSLTGNHMCDYGRGPFTDTLEKYQENGMEYFGGGKNETEAWEPLLIETNAGTVAFIGFNLMGPGSVIASEELAGAAYYDSAKLSSAMKVASEKADIIWVDTHLWPEYGTSPTNDQQQYSREAVTLGADIVTGVSSHEIQGMTFINETPVFYGLGNFLFDQMWSDETRQGLVLEITLYDNAIRKIELLPTVMYEYCQPRFVEDNQKDTLLDYFFSISNL